MFKSLILVKAEDRYRSIHFGFDDKLDQYVLENLKGVKFNQKLLSKKEDLDDNKFTVLISRSGIYYTQLKDMEDAQELIVALNSFNIDAEILG